MGHIRIRLLAGSGFCVAQAAATAASRAEVESLREVAKKAERDASLSGIPSVYTSAHLPRIIEIATASLLAHHILGLTSGCLVCVCLHWKCPYHGHISF
eukprot:COSAG05_NODE_276_length_12393_cov_1737.505694_4_plen_99_part_00